MAMAMVVALSTQTHETLRAFYVRCGVCATTARAIAPMLTDILGMRYRENERGRGERRSAFDWSHSNG